MEWISVEDRLPEEGTWCNLVRDLDSPFHDGSFEKLFNGDNPTKTVVCGRLRYKDEEGWGYWDQGTLASGHSFGAVDYITHWMPLPSPPEVK